MSDTTPKKKKPGLPTPMPPRPGAQLWMLAGLLVFLFGMFWFNNYNAAVKPTSRSLSKCCWPAT
jgi:cell division protease FtsH